MSVDNRSSSSASGTQQYSNGQTPQLTEEFLVETFCTALETQSNPWGPVSLVREFGYLRGRTDVVAVNDDDCVIAFEAKLDRWRTALNQAYRNTCFAHQSYVLLPKQVAVRASRYPFEFERRGVGICHLDDGQVVVLRPARTVMPLQPWLAEQALEAARNADDEQGTCSPDGDREVHLQG